MSSSQAQVALVNMPFSFSKYPSIQLGTLSALLKAKGIGVECHHLNVRFAHKIGIPLYESICEKRALFGEWLFSYLLFRDSEMGLEPVQPEIVARLLDGLLALAEDLKDQAT